ncbi:MAG TPA: hypothetical protein VK203_11870 [Nostocaceae cyanobacterium]|nr:hypothetical protein [Nostocaceae cyanobacterium]
MTKLTINLTKAKKQQPSYQLLNDFAQTIINYCDQQNHPSRRIINTGTLKKSLRFPRVPPFPLRIGGCRALVPRPFHDQSYS